MPKQQIRRATNATILRSHLRIYKKCNYMHEIHISRFARQMTDLCVDITTVHVELPYNKLVSKGLIEIPLFVKVRVHRCRDVIQTTEIVCWLTLYFATKWILIATAWQQKRMPSTIVGCITVKKYPKQEEPTHSILIITCPLTSDNYFFPRKVEHILIRIYLNIFQWV